MKYSASDALQIAKDLIAIPSVSHDSNHEISAYLEHLLTQMGFTVERLSYLDEHSQEKVSLVAKIGSGHGGLGLFSHSDTVPADRDGWKPFTPVVQAGRLIGRGACDMKGPLASTLVAAASVQATELVHPLMIVVTADEEQGYGGALQIIDESQILAAGWPHYALVAEPTQLRPVYAHKGGMRITVTATGRAAHTSTDKGISANFIIAPFLADMAVLAEKFKTDISFHNTEFSPPTNGFNMVINDGNCKSNVTAPKSVCTLSLRTMPDDNRAEAVRLISERAHHYGLEIDVYSREPFYTLAEAPLVKAALEATGHKTAATVPFGTEASVYGGHTDCVILGPGNIEQAHTLGEWIDVDQLTQAVYVYRRLIERFCL